MMTIEIITEIAQVSGLVLASTVIISAIYTYIRKAKRENEERLRFAIMREIIRSNNDKLEPVYCDYKALGGNAEAIIKGGDQLFVCATGKIEPYEPIAIKPHHCECCGAPMPKGTTKCEYCGAEYY